MKDRNTGNCMISQKSGYPDWYSVENGWKAREQIRTLTLATPHSTVTGLCLSETKQGGEGDEERDTVTVKFTVPQSPQLRCQVDSRIHRLLVHGITKGVIPQRLGADTQQFDAQYGGEAEWQELRRTWKLWDINQLPVAAVANHDKPRDLRQTQSLICLKARILN